MRGRTYKFLLFISFVAVSVTFSNADTFYISKSGADSNPGTKLLPWRTISKANLTLSAGDTVYILAGTYSSDPIRPINSGTLGNPITYTNYNEDIVTLKNVNTAIVLNRDDYIIVDGINIDGDSIDSDNVHQFAVIDNSEYCIIQNCTMQYAGGWHGIAFQGGASHNKILNNTIQYIGKTEPPAQDDYGDMIGFAEVDYNLIEGNIIRYAGHSLINIENGSYNIVRNNTFDNTDWGRCVNFSHANPVDTPQYNFFDYNKVINSSLWANNNTDFPNPGMQISLSYMTVRCNEFYDNIGMGIYLQWTEAGEGSYNKIYNNVFYHNGNNDSGTDMPAIELVDAGDMIDNVFKNNILRNNAIDGIVYDSGDPNKHVETNNWKDSNADPKFYNENGYDFHLQSDSPCIDQGAFLTHIVSSGSGMKIHVEEAAYFCDGFGLVNGDLVQLEGQTQTARITNVDYSNNTLTINQSLNWYSGQGISFAYKGFAPDIGAHEFDGAIPLAVSTSATPSSGTAPLAVSFIGLASGGFSPYSFAWNFGDGGTSTVQNPSHTYSNPGTYNVLLTVTDANNNQASDSFAITATSATGIQQLLLSTVTGSPSPGNGGSTDPSPGSYSYPQGDSVSVTAIPNNNYRFSIWNGDVLTADSYNEQVTVNMNNDKSLTANFCAKCGDVNGDLNLTAADAQATFDLFLGRIADPTQCEIENADVSCNGKITPGDAQAIFNKYIKKGELPADCSGKTRTQLASYASFQSLKTPPIQLIIDHSPLTSDKYVFIPIILDNPLNIDAFGFDIQFPSKSLDFVNIETSELLQDFIQVDANLIEEGTIRIGGYSDSPLMIESPEVLITLVFRVKTNTFDPATIIINNTFDDLSNAMIRNGIITYKIEPEKISIDSNRQIINKIRF